VEALTGRDAKQANTITDTEETLRRESFPPHEHDQYSKMPIGGQAHQSITEQVVERARTAQSVRQAPEPDKLSCAAVRPLWKWETDRMVELAMGVIRTRQHPGDCMRPSTIVIRKPGKDNYMKLKVYCSMCQLSCMGTVVETVVAELPG